MTLDISDLEIGYRQNKKAISIAKGLNLSISEGQLICLMGPNGAGKSTLLRTITGLQQALAGSIKIAGRDINSLPPQERAKLIAVVLTETPSNGLMTVREAVALGRFPHTNWRDEKSGEDLEQIANALNTVGLNERAEQPIMQLSDGYIQKVSIGRALCQSTPLIVLDEPTVHLDVSNKREIMRLLRELCTAKNKSILISTHDLSLARAFADQIWLLDKGTISQGYPQDLLLQGQIAQVFGQDESKSLSPPGIMEVQLVGDEQIVQIVAEGLAKAGIYHSPNASKVIQCQASENEQQYQLSDSTKSANSIEQLIALLLQI